MIFSIYFEILSHTQFTIDTVKEPDIGKINNMLAGDFNILEYLLPSFFAMMVFPVAIIGLCLIMVFVIHPTTCFSMIIAFVIFPFQILVGKWIGMILK